MPRPVTPEEAAAIRWLLAHPSDPDAPALPSDAVDALTVVAECSCGCGSIEFDDEAKPWIVADALAVEGGGKSSWADVILWAGARGLHSLEIVQGNPHATRRLPTVAELRTWEDWGAELAGRGAV